MLPGMIATPAMRRALPKSPRISFADEPIAKRNTGSPRPGDARPMTDNLNHLIRRGTDQELGRRALRHPGFLGD